MEPEVVDASDEAGGVHEHEVALAQVGLERVQ